MVFIILRYLVTSIWNNRKNHKSCKSKYNIFDLPICSLVLNDSDLPKSMPPLSDVFFPLAARVCGGGNLPCPPKIYMSLNYINEAYSCQCADLSPSDIHIRIIKKYFTI